MALLKPMLAAEADLEQIQYPVYASPKLDGIRATVQGGVLLSRTLKPIPNKYVQSFDWSAYEGFDGELIVGSPTDPDVYRNTVSGMMSHEGEPDFIFYVFDDIKRGDGPYDNMASLTERFFAGGKLVPQSTLLNSIKLTTEEQLLRYEAYCLCDGYEGLILRKQGSPYKHGRSTVKQGYLLKLKRFKDAEAEIIGVEELLHNANEAKTNGLGYQERSHEQAGMVPMDTLGALVVRDCKTGVEFKVGTGFTQAERKALWGQQTSLTGRLIKYKYFDVGVKEKPRHPVWLGFRDPADLGE